MPSHHTDFKTYHYHARPWVDIAREVGSCRYAQAMIQTIAAVPVADMR